MPFVAAAGNHDIELLDRPAPLRRSRRPYNRFMSSFADYPVDGRYGAGDFRNTYHLFTAGGVDLMVLNLDFGPTSGELAWAGRVAASTRTATSCCSPTTTSAPTDCCAASRTPRTRRCRTTTTPPGTTACRSGRSS